MKNILRDSFPRNKAAEEMRLFDIIFALHNVASSTPAHYLPTCTNLQAR